VDEKSPEEDPRIVDVEASDAEQEAGMFGPRIPKDSAGFILFFAIHHPTTEATRETLVSGIQADRTLGGGGSTSQESLGNPETQCFFIDFLKFHEKLEHG